MKTSMLDYCKLILKAVQFDSQLFQKEYEKSMQRLNFSEAIQLRLWVTQHLSSQRKNISSVTTQK
jgi:hypothetical protein